MTDYSALHASYLSEQMSEKQWQEHLAADDGLRAWVTTVEVTKQPLTLDDVSKRVNTIMTDYVEQAKRVKDSYETALDALAADVEASPDLDKEAVNSIIFGRMKKMLTEAAQVFG